MAAALGSSTVRDALLAPLIYYFAWRWISVLGHLCQATQQPPAALARHGPLGGWGLWWL